jgi:hypothetical protein
VIFAESIIGRPAYGCSVVSRGRVLVAPGRGAYRFTDLQGCQAPHGRLSRGTRGRPVAEDRLEACLLASTLKGNKSSAISMPLSTVILNPTTLAKVDAPPPVIPPRYKQQQS